MCPPPRFRDARTVIAWCRCAAGGAAAPVRSACRAQFMKVRATVQSLAFRCLPVSIIAFAVLVTACSGLQPTSWRLTAQQSGSELHILVVMSPCDDFDSTSVAETLSTVRVSAFIRQGVRSTCVAAIIPEPETVRLAEPLGNRTLQGCNPPASVYQSPDISNTDCVGSAVPPTAP